MNVRRATPCLLLWAAWLVPFACGGEQEFVAVSPDKRGFLLAKSGLPFVPWGLNYDHDEQGRLIEDYWTDEWAKVEEDFAEMRALSANVVRIHLQLGRFMTSADKPNEAALAQLGRLVHLAERQGLYLNLTGLGCYHKADVPAWYDALPQSERWAVQSAFWTAIAGRCANSPAIFCYDLMNEPVVSGGPAKDDWLGPAFAGKHFVQYIARDHSGRGRAEIAREWIGRLVGAIRQHDRRHLITVGLVDWSLDRPGLTSGFPPNTIADGLDFVSVHVYPESAKLETALTAIRGFAVGKPLVIEETFPLKCSARELEQVMDQSRGEVSGWVGFYWGKTIDECRTSGTIGDAMMAAWLELFRTRAPKSAAATK